MIKIMDKHTIIRLLEAGRSQRSVSRELGLNRKTIGRGQMSIK